MRSTSLRQAESAGSRGPLAADPPAGVDRPVGRCCCSALIDRGQARQAASARDVVGDHAETVRSVEVRDLFERFIPEDERVKRLGDVIDRASDPGPARRRANAAGSSSPTNSAAQCKTLSQGSATSARPSGPT